MSNETEEIYRRLAREYEGELVPHNAMLADVRHLLDLLAVSEAKSFEHYNRWLSGGEALQEEVKQLKFALANAEAERERLATWRTETGNHYQELAHRFAFAQKEHAEALANARNQVLEIVQSEIARQAEFGMYPSAEDFRIALEKSEESLQVSKRS